MSWNSFKQLSFSPSFTRRASYQPNVQMGACLSRTECPCEDGNNTATSPHFVRLSGYAISPFTARIRLALHFKGIQPDLLEPTLTPEQELAWLDGTFDDERFPRLEHGQDVVTGSSDSILSYIDKKFKQPPLFPSWTMKQRTKHWVLYVRDVFTPLLVEAWNNKSFSWDQELHDRVGAAFVMLNSGMLENSRSGEFFMGKYFSMVDVYLIPFLELLEPLRYLQGIQVDSREHRKVAEYIRKMASFTSYVQVAVDKERLKAMACKELEERMQISPAVRFTLLQHTSIVRHLGRLVSVADELVEFYQGKKGRFRKTIKRETQRLPPAVQVGISIKLKRAAGDYERLLTLMKEHAQMEEMILFSALEKAQRGITKTAIQEHAREFPVMNGVHEYLKTVMVLEHGSLSQVEALVALTAKLHTLKDSTGNHFLNEQRELLPLLDVAGLGLKQQDLLTLEGISVMKNSHSSLLPFFLSVLRPHETHQYMIMLRRSLRNAEMSRLEDLFRVLRSDDEFPDVWQVVQDRVPLLVAATAASSS